MSMTAFKAAIIMGAVVIAGVATPWAVQHRDQLRWRENNEAARRQAERLAELSAENRRLSNMAAQTEGSLPNDQSRELLRLRGEIGPLRQSVSEIRKLRVTNQQLLAGQANPENPSRAPSAPDPQTVRAYWPKTQLAFAGYADPASSLETALWAMSRGDPGVLAASVTPEARAKLAREQWDNHGTPDEEIATSTKKIADSLNPSSGFYIVGQNLISQDQAILDVYFEGEGKTRQFAMKKIDEEWKFDELGKGAWP